MQRRRAEIEEYRTIQWQARTQARRDLQPPLRVFAQLRNQRPGVETLRFDQPRIRPQAVVETPVAFGETGFAARLRKRIHVTRQTRVRCGTSSSTANPRPSPADASSSARCGIRARDAALGW